MEKWYYYRLARIWMWRNPFKGMALIAVVAFFAGSGVYAFLDQYHWGKKLLDLIFMMISFEATTTTMIANGRPFWQIIILIIVADACNILLDLFIVKWILKWQSLRNKIDWLSRQGKRFWLRIKSFLRQIFFWLPGIHPSKDSTNGWINYLDGWNRKLEDYKKNPTKAGYSAIFLLSLMPRIPLMVVGGVSIAVFIIRYNRFDYRGWLTLFLGMGLRTIIWLSSMYGLISIF